MARLIPVVLSGIALLTLASNPGIAAADPVTMINGSPPPGILAPLAGVTTMIDTIQADGNRLVVMQGIRTVGTRTPIHFHGFGGYTCVLSGIITDFIEGEEPATFSAGSCYVMPPDVAMSAANLGTEDAHLIDNFSLPPWADTMTVLEPVDWIYPITAP